MEDLSWKFTRSYEDLGGFYFFLRATVNTMVPFEIP